MTSLGKINFRRFLRHTTARSIFSEPLPGIITYNAVLRLLVENDKLNKWKSRITNDMWPGARQMMIAIIKYPGSKESNHSVGVITSSN